MSKHETKMTQWYAETHYPKGYLIEEFMALEAGPKNGRRLIDGVIVFRKPFVKRKLIKGERVVVVQSKHRRLGMGLIGQVIVSRDLLLSKGYDVIKSVGVCTEMDTVMHRMLRMHPRCRAVVYSASRARARGTRAGVDWLNGRDAVAPLPAGGARERQLGWHAVPTLPDEIRTARGAVPTRGIEKRGPGTGGGYII